MMVFRVDDIVPRYVVYLVNEGQIETAVLTMALHGSFGRCIVPAGQVCIKGQILELPLEQL